MVNRNRVKELKPKLNYRGIKTLLRVIRTIESEYKR